MHYIGLMSGTSINAVDAALVSFSKNSIKILAAHSIAIPKKLKKEILALCFPGKNEIERMGELDYQLGKYFAKAACEVAKKANLSLKKIKAIGSHGQTIRHRPNQRYPFTLQIGNPHLIAAKTGITTVANFRAKDIALGGQGAPLAPVFHDFLFRSFLNQHKQNCLSVINIGGIANISVLQKNFSRKLFGFDIGPGNTLLDAWIYQQTKKLFDRNGQWASGGKVCEPLLKKLCQDSYFKKSFPKSTGREYFNLIWLKKYLKQFKKIKPQDVQATLTEFTAKMIAEAVMKFQQNGFVFLCGGGAYNRDLVKRIQSRLKNHQVITTDKIGIAPKWIEAAMFAWLAKQTLDKKALDLSHITGSKKPAVLGEVCYF